MSYVLYLFLFAQSGVSSNILGCVFTLFVFVPCCLLNVARFSTLSILD